MKIDCPKHYKQTGVCSDGHCPACYLKSAHDKSQCFDIKHYRIPYMDHLLTYRDKRQLGAVPLVHSERVMIAHVMPHNLKSKSFEDFSKMCADVGIRIDVFPDSWYDEGCCRLEFRDQSLHEGEEIPA